MRRPDTTRPVPAACRPARRLVRAPPERSRRRLRQDPALLHARSIPRTSTTSKHAWVERIGDECRANDIPFFLEFVGYEEGADEKGLEYAKKKPQIVTESMREFSKDRYGVDVLKVEVPVNMKFVEGTKSFGGQKAYTKKEAIDLFHKAANVATKPFIYLSAGVSNAEFSETLELAGESGVKFNGVLCGRATWKDGIPVYAKQGARCLPQVARNRRRKEHPQRQRQAESRDALALDLRTSSPRWRVSSSITSAKTRGVPKWARLSCYDFIATRSSLGF